MTLEPGCRTRNCHTSVCVSHLDTPIPTSFRYLPPLSYTHFPSLIFIHPDLANVSSHGPGALGHLVCVAVWPRWPRRLHEGQEPTQCEYLVGRCTPSCMLHEGRPVPSPLPCVSLHLTAHGGVIHEAHVCPSVTTVIMSRESHIHSPILPLCPLINPHPLFDAAHWWTGFRSRLRWDRLLHQCEQLMQFVTIGRIFYPVWHHPFTATIPRFPPNNLTTPPRDTTRDLHLPSTNL